MKSIATIGVEEDSPRQVLLDALNDCEDMRTLVVLAITHDADLLCSTTGSTIDKLALIGMLSAHVTRKVLDFE